MSKTAWQNKSSDSPYTTKNNEPLKIRSNWNSIYGFMANKSDEKE